MLLNKTGYQLVRLCSSQDFILESGKELCVHIQEAHCRIPGILSANPLIGILNAHAPLMLSSKIRGLAVRIPWNPERQ
jgi:hypothetical protein